MATPGQPDRRPRRAAGARRTWSIDEAVERIAQGGMVVAVDDEDRENEGDLIMAADAVTTEDVAFFLTYTSGFLCTSITPHRARELELEPMTDENSESQGTAFLVSVDLRRGTTTGISAPDRAATIRALADPAATASDFRRPGHVMPLEARPGGVLKRAGHTEAAVDLCKMAGRASAGLLCEIVTHDRRDMMRRPDLERFAVEHDLPMISIASLVKHRRLKTRLVERISEAALPTRYGEFRALAYRGVVDGIEHLALVKGDVGRGDPVLVRVHSECLTGDIVGSLRCDCGDQLRLALERVGEAQSGAVIYLRGQEGRGIGLGHKIRAYSLQQEYGLDTVDANLELGLPVDSRDYGVGAAILADLGIRQIRLMTNNPAKYGGLKGYGITIVDRVPLQTDANEHNISYLHSKRRRLGHALDLAEPEAASHLSDAETTACASLETP